MAEGGCVLGGGQRVCVCGGGGCVCVFWGGEGGEGGDNYQSTSFIRQVSLLS
jgi:hypothetical protein